MMMENYAIIEKMLSQLHHKQITGEGSQSTNHDASQMTNDVEMTGAGELWMNGAEEAEEEGWMNGGERQGAETDDLGIFSTKENESEDAITMVISPDLPYHLLSPTQEDIDEFEDLEENEPESTSDDGKVYTDSLSEMCLCVCKICSTKMKFNSLREHVRIQHNLRMSQYKQQYGKIAYSRMTYHRCKGCGKVLRAIYATIKKHLQTVHSLSFKDYATKYHVFKGRFDKKEDVCIDEDREFEDDPSKMCMTVCKVCNTNLEPYNMKNHVKGKHYLSMNEYRKNFGEIEFITEVFHRCKVCEKTVLFEYQKLSNHLFFNHGIGIAKYKDFLLGKISLDTLKQMEPQSPKTKSSRNGVTDSAPRNQNSEDTKKPKPKKRSSPSSTQPSFNPSLLNPFYSQTNLSLALLQSLQGGAQSSAQGNQALLQSFQLNQALFQSLQGNRNLFQNSQGNQALMQSLQAYQTLLQNPFLMQQHLNFPAATSSTDAMSSLILNQALAAKSSDLEVSLSRQSQTLASLMKASQLFSKATEESLVKSPVALNIGETSGEGHK